MKRFLLLVTLISAGFAAAEDRKDGVSASGKIAWHVVRVDDQGISEVLISEADQGESAPQKLCEAVSVANTKVSVSPDDSWIIVQTGGASLGISLTVFRRENGMIYNEMPGMNIGAAVLLSACGSDQPRADAMDRVYMDLVGWSKDSGSVLVGLNARGEKGEISEFFAIYDLAERKVGFDLVKFNATGSRVTGR